MKFHDLQKVNEIDISTLEIWRDMENNLLKFMSDFDNDKQQNITDEQIILCLRNIQEYTALDCPTDTERSRNLLRSFEMICRIAISLAESIVDNSGDVSSSYIKDKLYCAIRWLKLDPYEEKENQYPK